MNVQLVLTLPHKSVDALKSHDEIPVAIRGTAVTSLMYNENFPSLLVLPTEE